MIPKKRLMTVRGSVQAGEGSPVSGILPWEILIRPSYAVLGLRTLVFAALALLAASTGCSSFGGGGKGFSLFPTAHRLTDDADSFRHANLGNLQVPRELEKQS